MSPSDIRILSLYTSGTKTKIMFPSNATGLIIILDSDVRNYVIQCNIKPVAFYVILVTHLQHSNRMVSDTSHKRMIQ